MQNWGKIRIDCAAVLIVRFVGVKKQHVDQAKALKDDHGQDEANGCKQSKRGWSKLDCRRRRTIFQAWNGK